MGLVASPPGVITGGAAHYDGEDLIGAPYRRLREMRGNNVAYIFQDPLATLHPLYRVGDQLIEAIRAHHADRQARGSRQGRRIAESGTDSERGNAGDGLPA